MTERDLLTLCGWFVGACVADQIIYWSSYALGWQWSAAGSLLVGMVIGFVGLAIGMKKVLEP